MFNPRVERIITFPLLHEGESISDFTPQVEIHYTFPTMYDERIDEKTRRALEQLERYKNVIIKTIKIPLSDDVHMSLAETLEKNKQYIPADQAAQYQSIVKPALESAHKDGLTVSDIIAILTLLVTLYSAISQSIPDRQTAQIINQNEVIIQNQEKIIERIDDSPKESLDALTDSIYAITDEVKSLREYLERIDNPAEIEGQADTDDSQQ